jgi:signal peptidase I
MKISGSSSGANVMKKYRNIFITLLESLLKRNKEVVFAVKGGSMNPFIKDGDNVIIKKPTEIKVGDVVFYKTGDWVLMHRVVKIKKDNTQKKEKDVRYIVKGDSLDDVSHVVEGKKIVGIVKEKWYNKLIATVVGRFI